MILICARVLDQQRNGAEMGAKVYTLYTFALPIEYSVTLRNADLSAPRTACTLLMITHFAMNNRRKGCAGLREAQVRSGRMLESSPCKTGKTQRRTVANAEPEEARSQRPAKPAAWDSHKKTRAKRYPDSEHTRCEPSSRSPQDVERAKTWVLRRDYGQVMGQRQQEAIAAPFNEGILGTGAAKFYNTYNPFVGFANSYQTAKINKEFYGTDQANLWRNEIVSGIGGPAFKADKITGELDYKLTMKDLIGAIPLVGGIINSGIDYDANGNQRRGGWKWNPQEGGAAVTTAAAGLLFSVYGVYGAEYVNKQTYGEQHSNYDQLGVGTGLGSTIGAYAGAIAAAFGMQAANAEFDSQNGTSASKGLTRAEADAANATSTTHQGAGILQGSGYALGLRRYGNYIGQQVAGIGMGAFDSNGFTGIGAAAGGVASWFAGVAGGSAYTALNAVTGVSQRVSNFFSADFNGERWNFETDQQQMQRGLAEVNLLAQNGDLEQAKLLVGRLGLKAEQAQAFQAQLEETYTRDVPYTQASYEAREVAHQYGVAKDGEGILYREVQRELDKIVGKDKNASPADILEAGKRASESLGYNTSGKEIDWGKVSQGRASAISSDLTRRTSNLQTQPLNTSGLWMDPLFVNADSSYSLGNPGNIGVGNFLGEGDKITQSKEWQDYKSDQANMYYTVGRTVRPNYFAIPSPSASYLSANDSYSAQSAWMRDFARRPDVQAAGVGALFPAQARAFPELMLQTNTTIGLTAASAVTGGLAGAATQKAIAAAVQSANRATQIAGNLAGRVAWGSLAAEVFGGAGFNTVNTVMQAGMANENIDGSMVAWGAVEGAVLGAVTFGFGTVGGSLRSPLTGARLTLGQQSAVFGISMGGYDFTKQALTSGFHNTNPLQSLTTVALGAGGYYLGARIYGSAQQPVTIGGQFQYDMASNLFLVLPTIVAERQAYNLWYGE